MEGVLQIEGEFDWCSICYSGIGICLVLIGLIIGLRYRQVICHKLQPIINNLHHHYLNVQAEVKEEEEKEVKEEEVKEVKVVKKKVKKEVNKEK